MIDYQSNYLTMAKTVMGVMEVNLVIWSGNIKIVTAVAEIKGLIEDICALEGIQSDSAKGATKSEHQAWKVAAELAEHVCFGLKAYYNDINDQTLFGMVNYTFYKFTHGRREVARDRMQKVHDKASSIPILDLAVFNVNSQNLTDLQAAIVAFDKSIPVRSSMIARSSAATKELPGAFKALREKFKYLDLLIGTLKNTQRSFYDAYKKSRRIIHLGKTQQAVELNLQAREFKAIFGKKFKAGYWFTVRNHSDFPAVLYLTDEPNELSVKNEVTIVGKAEVKLKVPADFNKIFGHWLMVFNPNTLDGVKLTVIRARKKSKSRAKELVKRKR